MRRLLNNPWIVLGLVVVAIALALWPEIAQRFASPGKKPAIFAGSAASPVDVPVDPGSALTARIRQAFADATFGEPVRDPFAFSEQPAEPPPGPESAVHVQTQTVRVTAIWMQDGSSLALVNGKVAASGDRVGFLDITEIKPDGVWFADSGHRTFLTVGEEQTFEKTPEPSAPAQP